MLCGRTLFAATPETHTATDSISASGARRNLAVHGLFRQDSKARLGRVAERSAYPVDLEGGLSNVSETKAEDSAYEDGTDAMIGVDARFTRDDIAVVVDKIRPRLTTTGSECQRVRSLYALLLREVKLGAWIKAVELYV